MGYCVNYTRRAMDEGQWFTFALNLQRLLSYIQNVKSIELTRSGEDADKPAFTPDAVCFNGLDDESCQNFFTWRTETGRTFVKTNWYPYDVAVKDALLLLWDAGGLENINAEDGQIDEFNYGFKRALAYIKHAGCTLVNRKKVNSFMQRQLEYGTSSRTANEDGLYQFGVEYESEQECDEAEKGEASERPRKRAKLQTMMQYVESTMSVDHKARFAAEEEARKKLVQYLGTGEKEGGEDDFADASDEEYPTPQNAYL